MHSPTKRRQAAAAAGGTAAGAAEQECAERIESSMNELVKLSDEKLNIATQIYDYIDRHITKLDKDCHAFDAEIAKERQRLGMPPVEPTIGGASGTVIDVGKRKNKPGEQRKLTPDEQYQVCLRAVRVSPCRKKLALDGRYAGAPPPPCHLTLVLIVCAHMCVCVCAASPGDG